MLHVCVYVQVAKVNSYLSTNQEHLHNDDDDDDNDDDEHNDWSGTTQDNKIAKRLSHQEDAMKHISLQMETFIYLIIDNVSGLILVMGKHGSN